MCHTLDREQINQKLRELENQIRKSYNNVSILDHVCTLESVSEETDYGTYQQFAGKFEINRERVTNPTNFLMLGELGASVARSEIIFLINELSTFAKSEIDTFSIDKIKEKVFMMRSQGYHPNTVFIPIEYYEDVFEWNKTHKPYGSGGSIVDSLYLDPISNLQIKYSNKKIEFEDVIITSKDANHWKYRPDAETNGRITAKFDWDVQNDENSILLVKTVFKFETDRNGGNTVLKIRDFQKGRK